MPAEKTFVDRLALSAALVYAVTWLALVLAANSRPDEFGYCWVQVVYLAMPIYKLVQASLPASFYFSIVLGAICNCVLLYVMIFFVRTAGRSLGRAWYRS